ncbi:cell division cycle 5-like protein (CDC5L) [Vairimorpha necatrix]|uniref:Cell division cycle 5-like protein (CDC5L) n=1 Tax=Vairimorpha necatrix TaxID=6039 RepID=A0AAX4JCJ6_9MICR
MALEKENNLWKKSEDEILKMGVMKYGPNKWNKVSSLLKRTPLECKERFENFLSLNNTWTEEEQEKLLEISRHLKPQWGLIGQIMNKSEQACYEKYISSVYKQIEVSKHDELKEATEEFVNEDVECAYKRIKKRINRKEKKNKIDYI